MKASEIKVGEEYGWWRKGDHPIAATRVRVLEVGVRREVRGGSTWSPRTVLSEKADGCRVKLDSGKETVIRTAVIQMTWADTLVAQGAAQQRAVARQEAADARKAARDLLNARLSSLGLSPGVRVQWRPEGDVLQWTIGDDDAKRLLDLLPTPEPPQ